MSRLIILGNGFDLHYGLPTKYKEHLVPILKKNNKDFFKIVDSIYFKGNPKLWSDFEGEIGYIKDDEILHTKFSEDLNLVFDVQPDTFPFESENDGADWMKEYEAAHEARSLTPNFKKAFKENNKEFIKEVFPFLEKGLRAMCEEAEDELEVKISDYLIEKDFNFRRDDKFITFNYTNTLEQIYDFIPEENICHLHKSLREPGFLIFGNSRNKIVPSFCNFSEENPYFDYGYNVEDESDSSRAYLEAVNFVDQDFDEYNDAANKIIDKLNKKFEKNIQRDRIELFLSDKDINEVWVFGTSIGDVDIPYFSYIKEKYPLAKWWISYYGEKEFSRISARMDPILESSVKYLSADEFSKNL